MNKFLYLLAELDNNSQIIFKEYEKIITENGFIGNQTKDIPYHITLCSYPLDKENDLKKLLENISKKYKEIKITFSSIGLFGLKVLFVNPDLNKKLIGLYNDVKAGGLCKDEDLAAHCTLLIDEPENIIKIIPKITEKFNKINGRIKYISLYEFFPAKLIKRIELME